jgi:putative ABC transport system permease protein
MRLRTALARLRAVFGARRSDATLDAEIREHLDRLAEDHERRGLRPVEARAAARRDFGGVDQMKEQMRDQRGLPWMDALVQDVRYGIRTLRRDPTFSIVAVLTLALGIGAVTAIFGGVKAVLFEPLPYAHADRIVQIAEISRDGRRNAGTFGLYRGLAERTRTFDAIAVMKPWLPTLTGADRPERLEGQRVSAAYFDVLGVVPALGRRLLPEDDRLGGPNVVVLSDALWRRRFARDPGIVGRTVTFDDTAFIVIGVTPAGFENVLSPSAELWAPLQYDMSLGSAWGHHLRTIGLRRAGAGIERAATDVEAVGRAVLDEQHPVTYGPDVTFSVLPLQDELARGIKPSLVAVLGAVSLLLLVACVNVTNLLLARGARRRAEFAMRVALGAGRRRLVRQLLTESLLLALAGGACGILVAVLGARVLAALTPLEMPRVAAIGVDTTALVFAMGVTTIVGVVIGLMPAWQSSQAPAGLQHGMLHGATTRTRARGVLVVAEVALALVLLVAAGLLFRSLQRLFAVSPGFDAAHVITMQVQASRQRFDKAGADRFFESALVAARHVPGVTAAAFTSQLPLSGDDDEYGVRFEGDAPNTGHTVFRYAVSAGYFEAIGIPLRGGRLLDARDTAAAPPVAIISESLARLKFGRDNPIGRRAHMGPPGLPWYTIVGVVGDVRQMSLAASQPDSVYIPVSQSWFAERSLSLVARVRGNAVSSAPLLRDAIWTVDKDQPVLRIATMENLVAASAAARRFALRLFESFALVALILAGIGLYGVLSGSVAERGRELAIRSALGASRGDVLGLVLRQGLVLTVAGMALGLLGAVVASGAIATLLFGVTRLDPVTYASVAALLAMASAAACGVPAWRAANIDPALALKAE